jgi:hypothetical protein
LSTDNSFNTDSIVALADHLSKAKVSNYEEVLKLSGGILNIFINEKNTESEMGILPFLLFESKILVPKNLFKNLVKKLIESPNNLDKSLQLKQLDSVNEYTLNIDLYKKTIDFFTCIFFYANMIIDKELSKVVLVDCKPWIVKNENTFRVRILYEYNPNFFLKYWTKPRDLNHFLNGPSNSSSAASNVEPQVDTRHFSSSSASNSTTTNPISVRD